MTRWMAAAIAFPLLVASPAAAQLSGLTEKPADNRWKIPSEVEPRVASRGVSLPVISYTAPDGSLEIKRGIVAGTEVAPNATVGVGLFETLPVKRGVAPPDLALERRSKRSRKAAIGFSLRF